MNLFYIRNLTSVHTAQSIISQFNYNNNIAFLLEDQTHLYKSKLKAEIDNSFFHKIETINVSGWKSNNTMRYIGFFIRTLKLKKRKHHIKNYLLHNNIQRIFLSNIKNYQEKLFFVTAQELEVEVNLYEEGFTLYTSIQPSQLDFGFKSIHTRLKKNFKIFFIKILYGNSESLLEKPISHFQATNVYALFPNLYSIKNYENLIRYKLIMPISENIFKNLKYLESQNLYLSRPFVEDKILTLDEEINLYIQVQNDFGPIIVKFHPRETEEKKELLKNRLNLTEVSKEIRNIPAEKIVLNIELSNLIGTFSNTLMYASAFTNIPVKSYILKINHNHRVVSVFEKFMLDNFKNIDYIE